MVTLRHPYLLLDELFHCQVVLGFSLHVFTLCFVERSHALSRTVTSNQPLSRVITNGHSWPFFSLLSVLLMFHHTWPHFITVGHALSRTVTLRNHSLLFVTLVQCQIAFFCSFHVVTHVTCSHAVTHCYVLWWMVPLGRWFSRLSLLFMYFHTWSR
jgi:hypothetical protein